LSLDQWIEDDGEALVLHDRNGRTLAFPAAAAEKGVLLRGRGIILTRGRNHCDVRDRRERRTRTFEPVGPGGRLSLTMIRDDFGNRIEIAYEDGRIVRVTDTAKRVIEVTY